MMKFALKMMNFMQMHRMLSSESVTLMAGGWSCSVSSAGRFLHVFFPFSSRFLAGAGEFCTWAARRHEETDRAWTVEKEETVVEEVMKFALK